MYHAVNNKKHAAFDYCEFSIFIFYFAKDGQAPRVYG